MRPVFLVGCVIATFGCGDEPVVHGTDPEPAFLSEELEGCMAATPFVVRSRGEDFLLVAGGRGRVSALDFDSGKEAWGVTMPVSDPEELSPFIVATPVLVDGRVFVAYGGYDPELSEDPLANEPASRLEHRVAAIDLEERAIDDTFEPVTLEAEVPAKLGDEPVRFNPPTALARGAVKHMPADEGPGTLYVTAGNKGDIQPWHGWVFELDLGAWSDDGADAAISAVLNTTPESDCGEPGSNGMYEMICGGGVWTPVGPQVFETDAGYELLVPTGNGHTDLELGLYANGLLRTGRGLAFDAGCAAEACADYDPIEPSLECLESCSDLFMPRLAASDPPLRPESGVCDELSFYECYAALDYDFGASSPARVPLPSGRAVYVQPAKDGHVYVIDTVHMGTMLEREEIVAQCGTPEHECQRAWTGMMVTEPAIVPIDDTLFVVVPTFMYDAVHPAGVVGLKLVEDGDEVRLEPAWQAPDFDSDEAKERFRSHPGRIALTGEGRETLAWVVDVHGFKRIDDSAAEQRPEKHGWLLGIRVRDGEIVERRPLKGRGERYLIPAVHQGNLYVGSCVSDEGPSHVEGHPIPGADASP